MHVREDRWTHPVGERFDVVASKASSAFLRIEMLRGKAQPDRLNDTPVRLPQLRERHSSARLLMRGVLHCLRVPRPGGLGIPLDLQVLTQLLAADRSSFEEQQVRLLENQGV